MTEGKQKLTLSVDAETIERAKSLGINISDLTEQVLRSLTYKPEDSEKNSLNEQRAQLFEAMSPLLGRYKIKVPVGEYSVYDPYNESYDEKGEVFLLGNGRFYVPGWNGDYNYQDEAEESEFTFDRLDEGEGTVSFYPTETILKNFMKAIEDEKTKRKQQVASLAVARKIVEAITQVDDAETLAKKQSGEMEGR